ncbi:hypothetical protein [Bradyrhizobium yuanmingense]|uniref:hypothetical protein n=1 Tax=Bradyrhizobium yuanmingense TaxID=108015 RepID=UPI0023B9DF15|nr:hypothetical protein [Bradyrhizobium yuanmingense]MDF0494403.1 hypothetical protein [Bradyrhizobium yuanmingense]
MLDQIKKSLKARVDAQLVEELLAAYQEAKHNYFLGGLRLSAVEGGRFCEAAMRMLQQIATGAFTPLSQSIDSERLFQQLKDTPRGAHPDSIRLNIPRVLRVVYDIRNGRDTAHLADGIDPNLQDATLVISNIDWALAEFVRLYHDVNADEAQRIVDGLVARAAPAVQDFNGFLKVLKPGLQASPYVLLLLYECGTRGALFDELHAWVRQPMRSNLRATLRRLADDKAFVHDDGDRFYITKLGIEEVEKKNLHGVS